MRIEIPRSVIIAVLLAAISIGCQARNVVGPNPAKPGQTQIPKMLPLNAKVFEPVAVQASKEWQADAYMTEVNVPVPLSQANSSSRIANAVSFAFSSKSDPSGLFVVYFDSNGIIKGEDVSSHTHDFISDPIGPNDWTLDSTEIWRIAQEKGERKFLEEHGSSSFSLICSLTLERWNPMDTGHVLWVVLCADPANTKGLRLLIDPETGEVVGTQNL